jgi:hypothetical protein
MNIPSAVIGVIASTLNLAVLGQVTPPAAPAAENLAPAPATVLALQDNEAQSDTTREPGQDVSNFSPGAAGANTWLRAAAKTASFGQVSVLCFKQPDEKDMGETMEDVATLAYLLSRNLEHAFAADTSEYKLGIPMLLTSGNQTVGASYVQGFGAILRMQVRFPLVGPADGSDTPKPDQTASEWEQARRELAAGEDQGTGFLPSSTSFYRSETGSEPYDSKLVQTFKRRVLVLLKNASNIRHLAGDESIIVKVVGAPISVNRFMSDAPAVHNKQDLLGQPKIALSNSGAAGEGSSGAGIGASGNKATSKRQARKTKPDSKQTTVMTLRVKKSDADAFASGSLSEDQFLNKAQSVAYLNPIQSDVGPEAGSPSPALR